MAKESMAKRGVAKEGENSMKVRKETHVKEEKLTKEKLKNIKDPDVQAYFMTLALKEALKAQKKGEVPVGAIVVDSEGCVIGRGHNLKETKGDATYHAEIQAIRQASKRKNAWRLEGCSLFSTLEPCFMCAGAILHARLQAVFFGAYDIKFGAAGSLVDAFQIEKANHVCMVTPHVLAYESQTLLKEFFKNVRALKKKELEVKKKNIPSQEASVRKKGLL
jgi:tRNA(adenine34) deaminase